VTATMRSRRGLVACTVLLLAVPLAVLYQMVVGPGVEAVIHGAFALGSGLMSSAALDFKTPRWATWLGVLSMGALAIVFFLQGLSEWLHHGWLTYVAYQVLGQRLEGWLLNFFMAWCVAVLVFDRQATMKVLGAVSVLTVAGVEAYAQVLARQGTSLDAQTPILKLLWLTPVVWLLLESAGRGRKHAS
jgi:hypothetical protein